MMTSVVFAIAPTLAAFGKTCPSTTTSIAVEGLDAGDGVPLAVVDRRAGHELGVAAGALEAAGRLPGLLELHLVSPALGRVEAFAEDVPSRPAAAGECRSSSCGS